MSDNRVIVITGPTASGKTGLGVALAKKLDGEVVSADSMQIYKYMNIGTAKPTDSEKDGVPHHMTDIVSPFHNYSVSDYVPAASSCVADIISRGKVPIVVGGTGLYIESLVAGRVFAPRAEDGKLRAALSEDYDRLGGAAMLQRLALYDEERAAKLHPNDKKRVVRALESALLGSALSEHDKNTKLRPPEFDAKIIVLGFEARQDLYSRINARVDDMFSKGLVDEVRSLINMGLDRSFTSMQAIGYKELAEYLDGSISLSDAAELIKLRSRRYAKRQISWCARYDKALRINLKNFSDFTGAVQDSTDFWFDKR